MWISLLAVLFITFLIRLMNAVTTRWCYSPNYYFCNTPPKLQKFGKWVSNKHGILLPNASGLLYLVILEICSTKLYVCCFVIQPLINMIFIAVVGNLCTILQMLFFCVLPKINHWIHDHFAWVNFIDVKFADLQIVVNGIREVRSRSDNFNFANLTIFAWLNSHR